MTLLPSNIRPIAASVPSDVAMDVEHIAIKTLLPAAVAHCEPYDSGRDERIASLGPKYFAIPFQRERIWVQTQHALTERKVGVRVKRQRNNDKE